jgi:RsiW-degrading membrane proteinase PrsW (M82 family)
MVARRAYSLYTVGMAEAPEAPLKVPCPACKATLKVPARLAGKRCACPKCKEPVRIPARDPSEEAPLDLAPVSDDEVSSDEAPIPDRLELAPRTPERAPARPSMSPPPREEEVAPAPAPPPAPTGLARHAHWALLLALIPLAFSLLGGDEDLAARVERTLAQVEEAKLERLPEDAGLDDLLRLVPDHRVEGAHLARESKLHWLYAAAAGAAFGGLLLAFPRGKATTGGMVGAALFTATVGIALLLGVQLAAELTYGVLVKGRGLLTLIFYIIKFIGFSYRAALDPENGFVPSLVGFTFGVGLCEELCKALPLVWHYRRAASLDWRGACLWGLASGVGFGVAEGIHYSGDTYNGVATGGIYVVRFVSCVALHATWSAGVGILIARDPTTVQGGMEWYHAALSILLVLAAAMGLHALYDTCLKRELYLLALLTAVASVGWLAFLIARQTREEAA